MLWQVSSASKHGVRRFRSPTCGLVLLRTGGGVPAAVLLCIKSAEMEAHHLRPAPVGQVCANADRLWRTDSSGSLKHRDLDSVAGIVRRRFPANLTKLSSRSLRLSEDSLAKICKISNAHAHHATATVPHPKSPYAPTHSLTYLRPRRHAWAQEHHGRGGRRRHLLGYIFA